MRLFLIEHELVEHWLKLGSTIRLDLNILGFSLNKNIPI